MQSTRVTSARVFAIAGPAMVANLTTPLIGVVSTIAIGRLGDATLLGGVAITSVVFDCLFWLFSFLRTSTVAFTAQALGAGETQEIRALLVRGLVIAALIGFGLIVLQMPLGMLLLDAMGGSEGVTRAARAYFAIRIWSAPIVLANFVVLGWLIGQARAGLALVIQIVDQRHQHGRDRRARHGNERRDRGRRDCGGRGGNRRARARRRGRARTITHQPLNVPRAALLDRAKLWRMLAVNRDIMIRTAALITTFLFFTAQGARSGDVTLAANAVLNNFLLISAFFLDGLANAAQQLCGQAYGARDRTPFPMRCGWCCRGDLALPSRSHLSSRCSGPWLIHTMTANADVQQDRAGLSVVRGGLAAACGLRFWL